jgi:hypothetical protein
MKVGMSIGDLGELPGHSCHQRGSDIDAIEQPAGNRKARKRNERIADRDKYKEGRNMPRVPRNAREALPAGNR